MRHPVVAHRVAEGSDDVLLTEHLVETLGAISAVEGLMLRHEPETTGRLPPGRPASLGPAPAMSGGGRVLCNGSP